MLQQMIYQIRSVIAAIIILAGIAHTGMSFTADLSAVNQTWSVGTGIALILSGVLNIVSVVNCSQRVLGYVTIGTNVVLLLFFFWALPSVSRPVMYGGIGLYLAVILLHASQLFKSVKPYRQYTQPAHEPNLNFIEALSDTTVVPIFRIFDKEKTVQFYVDWLGFKIDWEHRFAEGMPLYMQLSKAGIVLHLSEHHGDTVPGGKVYITCCGLREFHRQLTDKNYSYNKPGLERDGDTLEMTVIDPFGNKLLFTEKPGTER